MTIWELLGYAGWLFVRIAAGGALLFAFILVLVLLGMRFTRKD